MSILFLSSEVHATELLSLYLLAEVVAKSTGAPDNRLIALYQ
jgi:hypothetical protein